MVDEQEIIFDDEGKKKKKKRNFILPEGIIILVHEDGVLRIGEKDDFSENDWQYRVTDKTEKYMLIDLDKEKAMPLVKSILNDLELFPELRMLKVVHWLLYLTIFLIIIITGYVAYFGAKSDSLQKIEKSFSEFKQISEQKGKTNVIDTSSGVFKSKIQGVQKSE